MTAKTAGTTQGPAFAKASAIFPTQKDEAVAHYALERLTNKVLAREPYSAAVILKIMLLPNFHSPGGQ